MTIQQPDDQTDPFPGFRSPNYTQVPDELFDVLLPVLGGAELKVLMYIIRRTFGFKRDSDAISLSQMLTGIVKRDGERLDYGTGLTKKTLLKALSSLADRQIIFAERRITSAQGNMATVYRLNVKGSTPLGGINTPPLGEKVSRGSGLTPPRAWGRNSPTQETGEQETVEQNFYPSKLRKVETGENEVGTVSETRTELRMPKPQALAGGFATPADVLHAGGSYLSVIPAMASEPAAEPSATGNSQRPEMDTEEWVRLQFHMTQFRKEFGDQASLRSSTTRAYNLFGRSGLSMAAFAERMYRARAITQEHTATITAKGTDADSQTPRKTKIPYFFSVLEDLLDLLSPEERARREALREEAARKLEQRKGGNGRSMGDGDVPHQSANGSGRRPDSEGPYAHWVKS